MQATKSMPATTLGFLDECNNIVLKHLRQHVKKMFENSDTAFLEFAEKSQSSASQLHFFEAMNVIQKNRENVENIFYRELGRSFADFGCGTGQGDSTGNPDSDSMELVSKEDTDIQVAIQNMSASASLGSAQELVALRQRLAVLNNGQQLLDKDIPGGPACLARAFHTAAQCLVLEHQTLLIVYMLFNKFVLSKTTPLYNEYNKHLLKAGLLPNLKYQVRINPNKVQANSQQAAIDGTAPANYGSAPGNYGSAPGNYGSAPANNGTAPASSGTAPGNYGSAPANYGTAPANYGTAPASSGTAPGNYGSAPGNYGTAPANNGTAPANNGTTPENNESSNQSLGDELFGNIMQLLSRRNNQGDGDNSGNQGQPPTHVNNPLPQAELVSALHQLQQDNRTETPPVVVNPATATNIKENQKLVADMVANLSVERDRLFDGIDRRRLPAADAQIIDLVGMMFEYMLKDDAIPNVAKAELSRLHTPYLKVAIIDKGLFTNTRHPAHELLNTLARASARWVVEDKLERGIFPSVHNVVERVLAEFENNLDIFSELLMLFSVHVHDIEIKAAAIEKRTRQAAEGKEKLAVARKHAAAAITLCIEGHSVPAPVKKLLNDAWQEKLMFIYLREPDAAVSDSWNLAVQTVDAIIWSVEPRASIEAQTELRERLPEVQKQIELAFDTLHAYGGTNDESQLALIRDVQEAILSAPIKEATTAEQASEIPHVEAHETISPCAPAVSQNADGSETIVEALTADEQAALTKLQQVDFGTWFSIQEDAELLPERVKLSWFSQISGNYMFVNSMGMRTRIRKQSELAILMAAGKASIIEDEQRPLLQRALEAIRRMLGNDHYAAA